eukprot:5167126-Amphidinium_carterae.3
MRNYASLEEHLEDAKVEVDRLMSLGYNSVLSVETASNSFPSGVVSKLAVIVKPKADGLIKRRIIVDLLESGANGRSSCTERIVLPRTTDVIKDLAAVMPHATSDQFELANADLSDAYMHLRVHPAELDSDRCCHSLDGWFG